MIYTKITENENEDLNILNIDIIESLRIIEEKIRNTEFESEKKILLNIYRKLLEIELRSIIENSTKRFINNIDYTVELINNNHSIIENLLKKS